MHLCEILVFGHFFSAGTDDIYQITVTLSDGSRETDSASPSVEVLNAVPAIEAFENVNGPVPEGSDFTVRGALRDAVRIDTYEVQIDWGDGTVSDPKIDGPFEYSDTQFDTFNWELETFTFGQGGLAIARQEADRRIIDLSLNDPLAVGLIQVAAFNVFNDSVSPIECEKVSKFRGKAGPMF